MNKISKSGQGQRSGYSVIKSLPDSPGRSRAGPVLYVFSLLRCAGRKKRGEEEEQGRCLEVGRKKGGGWRAGDEGEGVGRRAPVLLTSLTGWLCSPAALAA